MSLLRCSVKVVLLALRPTPPVLSATLPLKLAGTVAARKALLLAGVLTDAEMGAVLSRMKEMALPVNVLPTLSVALAWIVKVVSASAAQLGKGTLLVQDVAVPPLVALLVVARANAPVCQPAPFQNLPSLLRCKVKVALLAFRPTPPVLSATLPLKLAGTVAARNELPPAGVVTDAVAGAVLSSVKLTAVPVNVLPAISVAVACTV